MPSGHLDGAAQPTETGLREDQAAALSVLTDGRRVSVINAPAGAGKTRVLADVAKAWEAAGLGPVVGIIASQSARNTLAAGVAQSYNSAQFLGHLPGRRGARVPVARGQPWPGGDDRRRRHRQRRGPDRLPPQRPPGRGRRARPDLGQRRPAPHRHRHPQGLLVRRALDADPKTGQRRWTDRQFLYADYKEAELGYAVTDHAAQGRTGISAGTQLRPDTSNPARPAPSTPKSQSGGYARSGRIER